MAKQTRRRGPFRLLCLMACVLLLSSQAFAVGDGAASLTLHYPHEGIEFQIYKAAVSGGAGGYTYTDAFTGCQTELPQVDDHNSVWQSAAKALSGYTVAQKLTPSRTGAVSGGRVAFSGLENGLYLVTGESHTTGNTTHTPTPFLVYVDGPVAAYVKADSSTPDPGTPDPPDDPGDPNDPSDPDDPGNPGDPGDPDDPGNPDDPGDPDNPGNPDDPGDPDDPGNPDDPGDPDTPNDPDDPGDPDIPQTGQLWWPVPLLACGGMVLFLTGWLRRRGSTDSESDE